MDKRQWLDESCQDRIVLLRHVHKTYTEFASKSSRDTASVFLSVPHVVQAVVSALIDIRRVAEFHLDPGKLPDRHKYAGFVARWIAKVRPIQLRHPLGQNLTSENLVLINPEFAVWVFYSFLQGGVPRGVFAQHLRYWFQFRDERGETLAFVAYCWEQMAGSSPPSSNER